MQMHYSTVFTYVTQVIILLYCVLYNNSSADNDECLNGTDNCDPNAHCNNTFGGFTCQCLVGFDGNGADCMGTY